ncbi:MAG TPA: hypothetical protein VHK63_00910 [Candidatus Limnocylindria bacterium]|nr:hypothetical protein [Candidatus Limnocylindria bacterium]
MSDWGFVAAGWGVVLGGLGLYAVTLLRRLASARAALADATPAAGAVGEPARDTE